MMKHLSRKKLLCLTLANALLISSFAPTAQLWAMRPEGTAFFESTEEALRRDDTPPAARTTLEPVRALSPQLVDRFLKAIETNVVQLAGIVQRPYQEQADALEKSLNESLSANPRSANPIFVKGIRAEITYYRRMGEASHSLYANRQYEGLLKLLSSLPESVAQQIKPKLESLEDYQGRIKQAEEMIKALRSEMVGQSNLESALAVADKEYELVNRINTRSSSLEDALVNRYFYTVSSVLSPNQQKVLQIELPGLKLLNHEQRINESNLALANDYQDILMAKQLLKKPLSTSDQRALAFSKIGRAIANKHSIIARLGVINVERIRRIEMLKRAGIISAITLSATLAGVVFIFMLVGGDSKGHQEKSAPETTTPAPAAPQLVPTAQNPQVTPSAVLFGPID